MSDEKKPFTVTDRRHFTPEGHARETEQAPEPAVPPEPETAPAADTEPAEPPHPSPPPDDEPDPGRQGAFPADFSSLLISLAAQGTLLLGLGGGEDAPEADFEGARSVIGLLEVLREKTEGRRTSREDALLDSILYELRMAYVARTRAGGA